jgi:hypothetical protein
MDLKAFVARTRNVSSLYGNDLTIVKPDCLTHESVRHGVLLCLDIEELMLGLAQTDNSRLLQCHGNLGIYPRATYSIQTT